MRHPFLPKIASPRSVVAQHTAAAAGIDTRDNSPPLTPENIARSELGRAYWNARASHSLHQQLQQADERLADARLGWRRAQRRKLAAQAAEWQRRRARAQAARHALQTRQALSAIAHYDAIMHQSAMQQSAMDQAACGPGDTPRAE